MIERDDEIVDVEIIYPKFYVDYNLETIRQFSGAVAHHCQAAAMTGQKTVEFEMPGITVAQILSLEEVMRAFGVEMTHTYIGEERIPKIFCNVEGLIKLQGELKDE
jgi:hypothetical protein